MKLNSLLFFLLITFTGWGQETLTITRGNFPSGSAYTNSEWTATASTSETITGRSNLFLGNTAHIQIGGSQLPHPYNSVAIPGAITKIQITMPGSGSLRQWTPRVSESNVLTSASGGTVLTSQTFTSDTGTLTWNLDPSDNYKYFYLQTNGNTNIANITIEYEAPSTCTPPADPNGTISGTTPACGTTSLTYTHGSGQPEADVTYYWQTSASGTSADNDASTPLSVTASGSYFVRAYNSVTECWSSASTSGYPVVINTAPSITTQPNTSDLETCSGINFSPNSVSVSATGTGLSYQWYRNTTASNTGGTVISGATSSSYTIPNNSTGTYYYYVVVTGAAPCSAVTSDVSGARTVNDLPATPTGLTSDSPQCAPGGVTISYSGTPEANVTWYWQTTANGTSTANSTPTYNATTTGTYYLRPRNTVTGCWGSSASIAVTVNPAVIGIASNPSPTNNNTNVCYAGDGAFTGLTWNSVSQANSYDVYFGAGSLPGTPTTTVTTTSYNPGTLLPSTTYYWKIVPKNSCGETTGTPIQWSFTTKSEICYCMPTTSNVPGDRINYFDIAGIDSFYYTSTTTSPNGYGDFYDTRSVTQSVGQDLIFMETYVTNSGASENHGFNIWVDWNKDGDFSDSGEKVFAGGIITSGVVEGFLDEFTIPALTAPGEYRMRIRAQYNTANPNPCGNVTWGEALDFKLIVIPPCTPAADPVGSISGDTETCTAASLTYSGTDVANAYWQTSPTGVDMSLPAGTPYDVPTAPGTYTVYVRIHDGTCWSADTVSHTIVVSALPTITAQPTNQSANVGATATFSVSADYAVSYQWQVNTGSGWSNIAGANSASYTTPNTTLAMDGNLYRVEISNACGEINSETAELSVAEGPCFEEDFQSGTVGYKTGSHTLPSGVWYFNDASIQNTSGALEAQLREGSYIETPTIPSGIEKVSFQAYRTGGGSGSMTVTYSTDGGTTWIPAIGSPFSITTTKSPYEATINTTSETIIRFTRTAATIRIDDIQVSCLTVPPCEPAEISLSPLSGPVGTVVTITGSDFSASSQVNFNGIPATSVQFINATTLEAVVPEGASTGTLTVDTELECDSEAAFTVIEEDFSECEGSVEIPGVTPGQGGLVFYEIFDRSGGDTGLLVVLNASYNDIGLNQYQIGRSADGTPGNLVSNWYEFPNQTLEPGELFILGIGTLSNCPAFPPTNGNILSGINEDDMFQIIRKSDNTVIDEVKAPDYIGYYFQRKTDVHLNPSPVYDSNDWNLTPTPSEYCQVGLGSTPIAPANPQSPSISDIAINYNNCSEIEIIVNSTPGGSGLLTYQWYVHTPETANWTPISNGGIYSGADTDVLTISGGSVSMNQYYVRVMEGDENCFSPSPAVQVEQNLNIWDGTTWSQGSPEIANMGILFAEDYDSSSDDYPTNGIYGCSVEVAEGVNVIISQGHNITIDNEITVAVGATFTLKDDANLVQINEEEVVNTGDIKVERTFTFSPERQQYNFVNSPVVGLNIKDIYPGEPRAQYYHEPTNKFIFYDGAYQAGRGVALSEPSTEYVASSTTVAEFEGVPFNGTLTLTGLTGDKTGFHLMGNPYPSQLDLDEFYADNSDVIEGRFLFWDNRGNTQITQYGDGYNGNHYAQYNASNSTGTAAATAVGTFKIPNGKLAVGSATMIRLQYGETNTSVVLNNSQRTTGTSVNFFGKVATSTEKDRYWLTMDTPGGLSVMNAVVYFEGGNDAYGMDDNTSAGGSDDFYTMADSKKLAIQGKAPFEVSDSITVGYKAFEPGAYKINLHEFEGVFAENVRIYLIDQETQTSHNLSEGSYSFESEAGEFQKRFLIVYQTEEIEEPEEPTEPEEPLSTVEFNPAGLAVYKHGKETVIASKELNLAGLQVYNLQGQLLWDKEDIHQKIYRLENNRFGKQTLILVVKTADGKEHNFKVLTH